MRIETLANRFYYWLIEFCREKGRFPTRDDILKRWKGRRDSLNEVLSILESQGRIKKKKGVYKVILNGKISYSTPLSIIWVIRISMILFAMIAGYMSIYYTYLWMREFLPTFPAILLSTAMVGFSVIAFETCIILRSNKKRFLMIIFILVWIVVLIFSMTSTIAGLYNARSLTLSENVDKIIDREYQSFQNEIYLSKKKELELRLEEYRLEYEMLKQDREEADIESKREQLWYRMVEVNRKIEKIREDIFELQKKELKNKKSIILEYIDFYDWLGAKIFKGIGSDKIQFLMSIFPAVFIDIIAPIALAVGLFLGRKNIK